MIPLPASPSSPTSSWPWRRRTRAQLAATQPAHARRNHEIVALPPRGSRKCKKNSRSAADSSPARVLGSAAAPPILPRTAPHSRPQPCRHFPRPTTASARPVAHPPRGTCCRSYPSSRAPSPSSTSSRAAASSPPPPHHHRASCSCSTPRPPPPTSPPGAGARRSPCALPPPSSSSTAPGGRPRRYARPACPSSRRWGWSLSPSSRQLRRRGHHVRVRPHGQEGAALAVWRFDPSCLSWLNELSPFLPSTGTSAAAARLGQAPFAPSPRSSLLLSTPTMPSLATISVLEFFSSTNFPDLSRPCHAKQPGIFLLKKAFLRFHGLICME